VNVYGHEDLSQTVVVQPTGVFVFPLIGAVEAATATPQEVEGRIAARLSKGLIREPRVSVVVQDYKSQAVHVVGQIARPGTYPLTGRTTVVELLARAGPLSPQAGTEVVVVGPGTAGVRRVDLAALQEGQLDRNLVLTAGDTLFVPEAERIFVTGEVRHPGAFAFRAGLTVRQAVSLAGGFSEDASTGGARVVRTTGNKAQTTKVKLDDEVRPGDTILIKAKLF
jgi:polysaccharide export outer membrane protein